MATFTLLLSLCVLLLVSDVAAFDAFQRTKRQGGMLGGQGGMKPGMSGPGQFGGQGGMQPGMGGQGQFGGQGGMSLGMRGQGQFGGQGGIKLGPGEQREKPNVKDLSLSIGGGFGKPPKAL
ncbi:hypothetical protein OESDEN_22068 [Oesophagostomum dentatum]|uniref:Uncharacterized protein n=1 Tax=Oesophagostomum dentatum TaxID=61180 RepID=A0A0B1S479_OESDE|nr:hypothetical protein OESDEN_22068 [Oesophagostomum dentatum]